MRDEKKWQNWEYRVLRALNQSTNAEDQGLTEDELIEQIANSPKEEIPRRIKEILFERDSMIRALASLARDGKRVPICFLCGEFFIAHRWSPRQKKLGAHCPRCAKKLRQRAWRVNYEKKHGHSYKQKREPLYVKKIRKLLEAAPVPATLEEKRDFAADADITLKQCEAALEIILNERKTKKRTGSNV